MENLDFYGVFDFSEGDSDIYEYTSAEFTALIKGISGTGIAINEGDKFAITASGLDITIGSGMCFIDGKYGYNDSDTIISLDAESVSLKRIDRIVLASDVTNRIIGLKVLKGTAAASPTVEALTQGDTYYEIPVCQVLIENGSDTTVTDEREYVYTPTEVNTKLEAILSGTEYVYAVYA